MTKTYLFLAIICIGLLASGSYILTRAMFADTTTSTTNSFSAATVFSISTPTPTGTQPSIVINEVFENSDNSGEWVELFNVSGSSVDISGWTISDNTSVDSLPTVAPIPAGGFIVLTTNPTTVVGIPGTAINVILTGAGGNLIGNGLANGGDKLILQNGSTIIDQMSWGSNFDIFNPGPSSPATGQSIKRVLNGTDADVAGDWQVGTSSIGVSN